MNIYLSFIFSFCLALIAFLKKSFTNLGLLTAFIISVVMCYCGGYQAFFSLVLLFIITKITDKVGLRNKENIIDNVHEKKDCRDLFQVLNNLFLATLFIVLYKISGLDKFMMMFYISLAISAADTSASGLGILSKNCYNLISLKKSDRGLSGNVSLIGLFSSVIAALIVGLSSLLYMSQILNVIIISIYGFLGSLIDSLLGCIQVKYICSDCKTITEKKIHCDKKTDYYKGLKILNNDGVNFLSNLICLVIYIIVDFI